MRVLLACSLGGQGHLGPLLPWAEAARRRGDDVRFVAPKSVAASIAAAGWAVEAGDDPPEEVVAALRQELVDAPPAQAVEIADVELFARRATAALLPAARAAVERWRPDLVLREPCEYASLVAAVEARTRHATVAISLADIEASVARVVAPVLPPGIAPAILAAPFLSRLPEALDPSPFADTRRYAVPLEALLRPLPDWWSGSSAPLLYVSLGTVTGRTTLAAEAYRTALAATDGLGVRVLLTIGRSTDPALIGPVPAHVHVEPWVAQADAFGAASAVVSHGGSGTTFGALAAGLPVAVLPLFADQFCNGQLVEAAGIGRTVDGGRPRLGFSTEDVHRLAAAMRFVLDDAGARTRAEAVRDQMTASPAVAEVLEELVVT